MREKKKINRLTVDEQMMLSLNPFTTNDFEISVNKLILKGVYKHDSDNTALPHEYQLEADTKISVYTHTDNRLMVARLNAGSKSLYLHIMYELESGVDYIEIMWKRYMKENNISSINTYKEALKYLIRYAIIAPVYGVEGVYWINPRYFFAGSRVNKYPDKVKIK